MRRKVASGISFGGVVALDFMESFVTFKPLTPRLREIRGPVLLMNGEHDLFTPRECHELLRRELPNCRPTLVQHAYPSRTASRLNSRVRRAILGWGGTPARSMRLRPLP